MYGDAVAHLAVPLDADSCPDHTGPAHLSARTHHHVWMENRARPYSRFCTHHTVGAHADAVGYNRIRRNDGRIVDPLGVPL